MAGGGGENVRAYRAALISFVLAIGGGIVAAIGYGTENTGNMLGLGLAVCLTAIGFGMVCWAKWMDIDEHVAQEREPLVLTPAASAELHEELAAGGRALGRRRVLVGLVGGSFLSLFVGFVGPIGSLGPKPRGERGRTSWRAGSRLVTIDGAPIDIRSATSFKELVTVFPQGSIGVDDSQVVLLRLPPELLTERTVERGAVDGWVAYSKICTHAGCSVGLFGIDDRPPETLRQLVCPCHQSVFDPADSARPVGGPATRSLPQLALDVDRSGFLVAKSPFDRIVGPVAWDEA